MNIPFKKIVLLWAVIAVVSFQSTFAQEATKITISKPEQAIEVSPNIYGQFIEYLRNSITGGIFQEGAELSDENGFRTDVLQKMKALNTPVLRYPGGTVTKIYHWEDGIGPRNERPARRNLIWGGVEDNHFGTDEYIKYCREIGAEPYIVVNMGTGTAEEAANWVEYCNGTGDTYYANLRRKYGGEEPYNVKFWSLGNEEAAREDAGRLYDPEKYAEESWYFAKLMKLTDPTIKLFVVADPFKFDWNDPVLASLSPIVDYVSLHWYVGNSPDDPYAIYKNITRFDTSLTELGDYLQQFPAKVENFSKWYRFPPREGAIKISVDEWGIWDNTCGGQYNLDCEYTWKSALATASFLNVFHRQAENVTMANWAQSANILGAILANDEGSVEQTVYYPLQYFRKYVGNRLMQVDVDDMPLIAEDQIVEALDMSATYSNENDEVCVFVVNRSYEEQYINLDFTDTKTSAATLVEMTAPNENSRNAIGEESVVSINEKPVKKNGAIKLAPLSINIVVVR
nr:alpha-L-arabinofuranosidase C-terminal domain-containing protein [uncultured Draconibacterium sp.]